ncbi:MAG: dipicolinate synthase subunit DpsA [Ignavibacteriales bacterium]
MKKILIIGGDIRYLYLIEKLREHNFDIDVLGYEKTSYSMLNVNKITLDELNINNYDFIFLPVSSIDNEGNIKAEFSDKEINLSKVNFNILKEKAYIIAGIKTKFMEELNIKNVIYFMEDDDIAIYNSVATAEGVIMKIIENTNYTIYGSNILVLGYGRCGETISRYLKSLGARVSVLVRDNKNYAKAEILGYNPYKIAELDNHLGEFNVIINTIPNLILDKEKINLIDSNAYLLDIASTNGFDMEYAIKNGIKIEKFMSIPAVIAPASAAPIIFDKISEVIFND